MSGLEQAVIASLAVIVGACVGAVLTNSGIAKQSKANNDRGFELDRENAEADLISIRRYIVDLRRQIIWDRIRFKYHSDAVRIRHQMGGVGTPLYEVELHEVDVWRDYVSSDQKRFVRVQRELDKLLIHIKRRFSRSNELSQLVDQLLVNSLQKYDDTGIVTNLSQDDNIVVEEKIKQECDRFIGATDTAWNGNMNRIIEILDDLNKAEVVTVDSKNVNEELQPFLTLITRSITRAIIKVWRGEI